MGRQLRPYLPGIPFHITSRIAFKRHLIKSDDCKQHVCSIVEDSLRKVDANLLAFCIMSNHLHLVVVQGNDPLWRLMQPLLSRTARHLQRVNRISGRIFGARYFANPCTTPNYLRYVIIYNHLNPCRAGMVENAHEYAWSSHSAYADDSSTLPLCDQVTPHVALFAEDETELQSNGGYLRHLTYWQNVDVGESSDDRVERIYPSAVAGNAVWDNRFASCGLSVNWRRPYRPDLRDIAGRIVAKRLPGADLASIKGRHMSRLVCEVRNEIVTAARRAGHSNVDVARYLCISESRVSEISAAAPSKRGVRRKMESRVMSME